MLRIEIQDNAVTDALIVLVSVYLSMIYAYSCPV